MARGKNMLASTGSSLSSLALVALLIPILAVDAQRTPTVIVQPPTGWFGVRISDQVLVDERGNAFFDSYPVVTSVDSPSPAAKAGVRAGDVLLTFNSHDMRGGSVELTRWLKAGAPFVLRIRRNDATRILRGTLGKRPENWEQKMIVELSMPEIMERQTGSVARSPMQRTAIVRSRMPAPEPLPQVLLPALGYGGGIYPFAGAEFTALNDDLSDALGVKLEGVFVTSVMEGSAARTAGLRGGDVIVKADGVKIENPIDLVSAIRGADMRSPTNHAIDLQIIRKHKPQTLTLRW
jgi:S1-C subfamily serine protease